MSEEEKKIKVTKNGPYIVTGHIPLRQQGIVGDDKGDSVDWEVRKEYDCTQQYILCRCGHSQNKPFCDGTHSLIQFEGEETASNAPYMDQAMLYKGQTVDLRDQQNLCAVARFCDRASSVWNLIMESDDPDARELAIFEAQNCPSGRLTIWEKDGSLMEPVHQQEVGVIEDEPANCKGPLRVTGKVSIESANGVEYEKRNRVTLCRCGESNNMPFCDAHHLRCDHMQGLDKE